MANKYLSPRVIINEIDNSLLYDNFSSGPLLLLGDTQRGPDNNV